MAHVIKSISAILCGIAGFLWGELDGLMVALIAFICMDYITGLIVGAVQHRLNSQVGFIGLIRKALILIVVAVAHIIDTQILGGESSVFRSAACGLYLANEGLSILENCGKLGVPYPKKLREILEQLRDKKEENENVRSETDETRSGK
ncbi:MAG: phage holin family protein [Clostridia bacterium]|nr:phage holin family protein [Clostridia bacterium]